MKRMTIGIVLLWATIVRAVDDRVTLTVTKIPVGITILRQSFTGQTEAAMVTALTVGPPAAAGVRVGHYVLEIKTEDSPEETHEMSHKEIMNCLKSATPPFDVTFGSEQDLMERRKRTAILKQFSKKKVEVLYDVIETKTGEAHLNGIVAAGKASMRAAKESIVQAEESLNTKVEEAKIALSTKVEEAKRSLSQTVTTLNSQIEAAGTAGQAIDAAKTLIEEKERTVKVLLESVPTKISEKLASRSESIEKSCVTKILDSLKNDTTLTTLAELTKSHEKLQKLVYWLAGGLAFLLFILLIAVGYTCYHMSQSPEGPEAHRQHRRRRKKSAQNDRRHRPAPRPKHQPQPRARPGPGPKPKGKRRERSRS